jgi:ribosomal protein L44E
MCGKTSLKYSMAKVEANLISKDSQLVKQFRTFLQRRPAKAAASLKPSPKSKSAQRIEINHACDVCPKGVRHRRAVSMDKVMPKLRDGLLNQACESPRLPALPDPDQHAGPRASMKARGDVQRW